MDTSDPRDPGQYTDEEAPDGRDTHTDGATPGSYEDLEEPDGTRAPRDTGEKPGEYTDADQ